jgi:hypothetical protein
MKWAAVEIRWDGAPPLPALLRVIANDLRALDAGYMYQRCGGELTAAHVTAEGVELTWYKHGGRMREIAAVIGYHHPCMVRWAEFGSADEEPGENEAWAALASAPWVRSREQGTPDAAGRIGRHPGGGKAHGRRGHVQPAMRAPVGARR